MKIAECYLLAKNQRWGLDGKGKTDLEAWQRLLLCSIHDWCWAWEWIRKGMRTPPTWLLKVWGAND